MEGSNRVQIVEKITPALEVKKNTKEADLVQNEISTEKKTLRKGGDAEKPELAATEIPAQTDTNYLRDQPVHNDKQKQQTPER